MLARVREWVWFKNLCQYTAGQTADLEAGYNQAVSLKMFLSSLVLGLDLGELILVGNC